jgi:hypothetical protein
MSGGIRFADVQEFLTAGLTSLGYATGNPDTNPTVRTLPVISPGPASVASLQKVTPGPLIFVQLGFGAGLQSEGLWDHQHLTVRVIGQQNDYASAENLMWDTDRLLLAVQGSGSIGASRVLYVARAGGSPGLIDFDAANRHHFQTTYVVPASTGY